MKDRFAVLCSEGTDYVFRDQIGVQQGSIIGPILFNLSLNCIVPEILRKPAKMDLDSLCYADDLIIHSTKSSTGRNLF